MKRPTTSMKIYSPTAILSLFLCVVAFVLVAGCEKPNAEKPKTILILTPETGPASEFARYSRMGFELAVAEMEENALQNGSLKVVYADSKSNPRDGLAALNQKLLTDKPAVIISQLSSVTSAIKQRALREGIPVIANAVAAPRVADPSKGIFRVFPTSTQVSHIAASTLSEMEAESVAIVYVNDEYGVGSLNTFEEAVKGKDLQLLHSEAYQIVERDFRIQWARILQLDPEAVFVVGYGPGYIAVLQQLAESDYSGIIMTDFTLTAPPVYKTTNALPGNTLVLSPIILDSFKKMVEGSFSDPAYYINIASAYDSVKMAISAIEKSDSKDVSVTDAMEEAIINHGSFGDGLAFDQNGDLKITLEVNTLDNIRKQTQSDEE